MNEVQNIQTHFECKMLTRANLPTRYSSCCVSGHIMLNHFCNLYCHDPNRGELVSKILVYKFESITKKGGMCLIRVSFFQLGFLGLEVQ